jgi:hypothetical protein
MTLEDWSYVATIAQTVVAVIALIAAFVAASIAWEQIKSAESENRKWKTLDICAQYELNPDLMRAAVLLRDFYNVKGGTTLDPAQIFKAARVVMNYLDGIAIGVAQGLYIEDLAKDHLKSIVRAHVQGIFGGGRQILSEEDFEKLIAMNAKWSKNECYYKARQGR